jgi:hypothetical protein
LFAQWGYPIHYLTDLPVDYRYARAFVAGGTPYKTFFPEYPPLAIWLITPPALHSGAQAVPYPVYDHRFALEMLAVTLASALIVIAASARLWPDRRRPYLAALVFAVFALALWRLWRLPCEVSLAPEPAEAG